MPTYNYVCKKCNYAFEKVQRIVDDPLSVCPECNEEELKKVIVAGGSGFQLKATSVKSQGTNKMSFSIIYKGLHNYPKM